MTIGRLAPFYRYIEYAAFGKALELQRFRLLDRLRAARRVLIAGEGDGRLLQRMLRVSAEASIDVLDVSAEMLNLARRRAGDSIRVRFRHEDARVAGFDDILDAVVTPFFLDCFEDRELRPLIRRLAAALRPGGQWLLIDFRVPERGWRKWHAKVWIAAMYGFFRVSTGLRASRLPPMEAVLTEEGFTCREAHDSRWGMIRSSLWVR